MENKSDLWRARDLHPQTPFAERSVPAGTPVLLSEKVYQLLRQEILTGVLKPGASLTEIALTRRLGASRTPIREACARLLNEGLLELIPNKGYFVPSISLGTVHDLFEARAILECAVVEKLCQSPPPELFARLAPLGRTTYTHNDARSYESFLNANSEFHVKLAEYAGNQYLVRLITGILVQLDRLSYLVMDVDRLGQDVAHEHEEILQAVQEGDGASAERFVRRHMERSKERALKVFLR